MQHLQKVLKYMTDINIARYFDLDVNFFLGSNLRAQRKKFPKMSTYHEHWTMIRAPCLKTFQPLSNIFHYHLACTLTEA